MVSPSECTGGSETVTTQWGTMYKPDQYATSIGLAVASTTCYNYIKVHFKSGNSGSGEVGWYDASHDLVDAVAYTIANDTFNYSTELDEQTSDGTTLNVGFYGQTLDTMYYTGYNDNKTEFSGARIKTTSTTGIKLPSSISGSNEADPVQVGVKHVSP